MASQDAFPHFKALPVCIRTDIWERAARDIFTTPAVRFVSISRGEPDKDTEDFIRSEISRAVSVIAEAEADPSWNPLQQNIFLDRVTISSAMAVDQALLGYNASLVSILPGKGDWPFASLAAVCRDAYKGVRWTLIMEGKKRRDSHNSVCPIIGPTEHSIICLEGPEVDSTDHFPFFDVFCARPRIILNGHQQLQPLTQTQIVVVGRRPGPDFNPWDATTAAYGPYRCPSFPELYPPIVDVRRVAFIYQEQDDDFHPFHSRLGLYALWPLNMPSLKEIYLIDKSIKPSATTTGGSQQQNLTAMSPSFAGCQGTFHEVSPDAVEQWDIRTADNNLLPVFECAEDLEVCYHTGEPAVPQVLVKVLAFIPHVQSE
jgi:hypothetical protein